MLSIAHPLAPNNGRADVESERGRYNSEAVQCGRKTRAELRRLKVDILVNSSKW